MAEVVPFRGVLYNPEKIADMADVVAPPYDVISAQQQQALHDRHPNNVIRLILGHSRPGEAGRSGFHTRAAEHFQQWMADGILLRDKQPAYYLTSVDFNLGERRITRYAIIACVRLEPFEKGIVLPHERTFSKVKSERLALMKACHTNFSPIFGLYADANGLLDRLVETAGTRRPDMKLDDTRGERHQLWRLTDAEQLEYIRAALEDQIIYIADGHHRYETAINYRNWVAENTDSFSADHPANFVMMSLSSLQDPGMVILPAHRLLRDVPSAAMADLLDKASESFEILSYKTDGDIKTAVAAVDAAMAENAHRHAIGLYIREQDAIHVLVLKPGEMARRYSGQMPDPLLDLDVTVLTRLLMMDLLGLDQQRLDDATKISYRTSAGDAVAAVNAGRADMTFMLNPTRIEQVQRVAQSGLIMPRKSTYFYPKAASGKVMNLLR